jgi:hypothetical protein
MSFVLTWNFESPVEWICLWIVRNPSTNQALGDLGGGGVDRTIDRTMYYIIGCLETKLKCGTFICHGGRDLWQDHASNYSNSGRDPRLCHITIIIRNSDRYLLHVELRLCIEYVHPFPPPIPIKITEQKLRHSKLQDMEWFDSFV